MANFYKIGFFIFFSIFLLALGASGAWLYFNSSSRDVKSEVEQKQAVNIRKEELSPTPEPSVIVPTSAPSPTPEKSDLEQIREAMAAKYGKSIEDTTVSLNENDGNFASGGVKFANEIAGAWLLAAKVDNNWMIVQDGNGTISCETIEPYGFPVSMVPECIDSIGNLITR